MTVMHTPTNTDDRAAARFERLERVLKQQKQASRAMPYPPLRQRREWLDRAIGLLVDHRNEIEQAINHDFGNRAMAQTGMIDLLASINNLKDAKKNLPRWMKPEKRKTAFPFNVLGGRSYVFHQPLGVVGIVTPWNAPLALSFIPLSNVLAAGNRAMIKLPEQVPVTSALIRRMLESAYDASEVAAFEGGPDMGHAFASQPFDHLLFTGGATVARKVLAATAPNLVPTTLELGGKAAVLIGAGSDIETVVPSVVSGRLMNGGQVCMGVDHLLVPAHQLPRAVAAASQAVRQLYPRVAGNPDFTTLISRESFARIKQMVDEAAALGATVIQHEPELAASIPETRPYCYPPTLVVDPPESSAVLCQEIFGPVLPIVGYESIDEALSFINRRERPLALYFFGRDKREQRRLLTQTWSGGVTINEVMMHIMMPDLPGGGVGESGTGRYVGRDGFRTFSNAKAVFENGWFNLNRMTRPPYGRFMQKLLDSGIRR